MNPKTLLAAAGSALLFTAVAAVAEIKTTVDHNNNESATSAFKFKNVPAPSASDAATTAKFKIVDGERDEAGAELEVLHDGKLPTEEDQPGANFFFNAGTWGGRLGIDLGGVTEIRQVNTYSWHPNTRGPQVYTLYGSDGKGDNFNAKPPHGTDPEKCGWKLIAKVDTRPKEGDAGGQYGVSITDSDGAIGKYNMLLFEMVKTESDDDFGNTFYSEIDVVTKGGGSETAEASTATVGEIKTTVEHNSNESATSAFKFKNVPAPSSSDAASKATFTIVDGERDEAGADLAALNDGKLPTEEDQPGANFFFNAGTWGGRLAIDLGRVAEIKQVNTYSWHPNTRGPQVYTLYGSDGKGDNFNAKPPHGTDPEKCGWKLIAKVDTRPKEGDAGGQYGVSITGSGGMVGRYSMLLFEMVKTESDDDFGNTFYSEIDVVTRGGDVAEGSRSAAAEPPYVIKSTDGYCEITIDTSGAPEYGEWARTKLAPALAEWYPKIVAMLPSEGFEAPKKFSVLIRPGRGVAATGGTSITVNSDWLKRELDREGVGALIHEEVHVVQSWGWGRRNNNGTNSNNGTGNVSANGSGNENRNRGGGRPPGYLQEGIPDYIRWYLFEPQSHGAEITQRGLARANYDGMYRVTANFLNFVVEKYDKNIITEMNAACRQRKYSDDLWKQYTGKTVEELNDEWKKGLAEKLGVKPAV